MIGPTAPLAALAATVEEDVHEEVADFGGLAIRWDRRVLRPRPWTTQESTWVAELGRGLPPGPILELCSGAGQIGLLAATLLGRDLVQVDQSPVAASYARRNAAAAGVRSDVRAEPLDAALRADERFPLVMADPPWVPSARVPDFPEDPPSAIDGGPDGTALIRLCLEVGLRHLAPGGILVVQVGALEQAHAVPSMLSELSASTGPSWAVLDIRDCRPGGVLVDVGREPEERDEGGQVSEVAAMPRTEGDEVVFPNDSTAGYPLDEGDGEEVQEGAAGPEAPPPENRRDNDHRPDRRP